MHKYFVTVIESIFQVLHLSISFPYNFLLLFDKCVVPINGKRNILLLARGHFKTFLFLTFTKQR